MSTQRHRRRRAMVERPHGQSAEPSLTTTILMLTVGALLTVATGLWAMQALQQFGPSVGSIIVFRPDMAAAERWTVSTTMVLPVRIGVPDGADARRCRLSPGF